MNTYHYVYILQSLSHPNQLYTGHTTDLHQRLQYHNSGKVPQTSKFTPRVVRSATAFRERARALAFERYLKTGSGRAFLKRHL
ncbi:MAG: GIY-YIG nuclease family protein [Limisphaerales bacterium]